MKRQRSDREQDVDDEDEETKKKPKRRASMPQLECKIRSSQHLIPRERSPV
jgi:hypothetical protein